MTVSLEQLQGLENKHGFNYPMIYKTLCQNNMLTWGEVNIHWKKEIYPTLKDNPPLSLYINHIEVMDFDDIEHITDMFLNQDDHMAINPNYLFVPFLQDGLGDYYCFWYHHDLPYLSKDDVPIVLFHHDYDEADILAKDLQDFIFYLMLYGVVDIESDSELMQDIETNLANYLKSHKKYLKPEHYDVIKKIYGYNFDDNKEGLIDEGEFIKMLHEHIGFKGLLTSFDCR
ncbi:SMI1/KNR4 family protein [Moraxella lacunata]|uniref:SMI1/KNR4 family protein n=1 Tax=Moraxella lacunata TaxID=477 RepID=A0A1V4GU16_MORLA|nr:SMI1/KNR4 family protein [Moraxella lacunata]OPH35616.1 SMI1/KNR4 family protein [Moraxella lacunata]